MRNHEQRVDVLAVVVLLGPFAKPAPKAQKTMKHPSTPEMVLRALSAGGETARDRRCAPNAPRRRSNLALRPGGSASSSAAISSPAALAPGLRIEREQPLAHARAQAADNRLSPTLTTRSPATNCSRSEATPAPVRRYGWRRSSASSRSIRPRSCNLAIAPQSVPAPSSFPGQSLRCAPDRRPVLATLLSAVARLK